MTHNGLHQNQAFRKGCKSNRYIEMILHKLISEENKHFVNRTINKIENVNNRWWKAMKDVACIHKNKTDNYFWKISG